MVLELGGNDPIIVMEDADLDEAATLALQGSYKNSGQRCTAVKRMLVHEALADALRRAAGRQDAGVELRRPDAIRKRRHGHGDRRGRGAQLFEARVNEAVAQGARLLVGNRRDGALYSPTVLDQRAPGHDAGAAGDLRPGVAGDPLRDIDEAIRIANGTAYGLSSAVCTNRARLHHALRLRAAGRHRQRARGAGLPLELTPFGGIKDSGLGYKEGVQEAMKSFTNLKTYSLPWE